MSEPVPTQGMDQVLLRGMAEVLGEAGAHAVVIAARDQLPQAGITSVTDGNPSSGIPAAAAISVSRLLEALERVYGPQAGRGLALRVGRACFPYALRTHGDALGLTGTAFRLLPTPSKFRAFGEGLVRLFNHPGDERVRLEEQDDRLLLHLQACPLCRDRHATEAICQLAVGVAEESLYWLSGGKIFHVEEVACAAKGDPSCTLQIDQAPLS